MSKKKKLANPSAGKQSREQLLNQQKNESAKKEESKQPEKSIMETMSEKREAMFGSLAQPAPPQPVAPPPRTNPAAPSGSSAQPAPRPAAPANGIATSTVPTPNPSSHSHIPGICSAHPGPLGTGGPNTPTAPGFLPSPNGPIKAPEKINTWMEVFKMTPADRQAWFVATPGAEPTFNMIIENAKRKHALVAAEKAKSQGSGSIPPVPGMENTRPSAIQPSSAPGPSRAALPSFTSPIPLRAIPANASTPARPSSTPVSGAQPQWNTAPAMAPSASSNPQLGSQTSHNQPPNVSNMPMTPAQELERLRAENAHMRSIMMDIRKAATAEAEKRGLAVNVPSQAQYTGLQSTSNGTGTSQVAQSNGPSQTTGAGTATNFRPPAETSSQLAETKKQSQELAFLHDALNKLSTETGKIKQENVNHLEELKAIRSDVENLRRENTRLGLETFKEKSGREALQTDKAKLESQVKQLRQQLQEKDERVMEAEREARRYRNEVELTKPAVEKMKEIIQEGERERRKIKIRLDAVKLLVLQDDLGDLSSLDMDGRVSSSSTLVEPFGREKEDIATRSDQQAPSLTPNSILPRPSRSRNSVSGSANGEMPTVPTPSASGTPAWSKNIKDRARSNESLKLLKVAWKLAAMERIVLPLTPSVSAMSSVALGADVTPPSGATSNEEGSPASSASDETRVAPNCEPALLNPVREAVAESTASEKRPENEVRDNIGSQDRNVTSPEATKSSEAKQSESKQADDKQEPLRNGHVRAPITTPLDAPPSCADQRSTDVKSPVGQVMKPESQEASLRKHEQETPAPQSNVFVSAKAAQRPVPETETLAPAVPLVSGPASPRKAHMPTQSKIPDASHVPHNAAQNPISSTSSQPRTCGFLGPVQQQLHRDPSLPWTHQRPAINQLYSGLPAMIDEVRAGTVDEDAVYQLGALLYVQRTAILRWYQERNLPSPYINLPASLLLRDSAASRADPPASHVNEANTSKSLPAANETKTEKAGQQTTNANALKSPKSPQAPLLSATESGSTRESDRTDLTTITRMGSAASSFTTACSNFSAKSRKIRTGKSRIATRVMAKLLGQRTRENDQTTADIDVTGIAEDPSVDDSSEYQTATDSEADSMSITSAADSCSSGSDAGTSDASDLERQVKETVQGQTDATRVVPILHLPDEIIQEIAYHLKPAYKPRQEFHHDMRIVMWEQDEIFNPSWGKDLFGFATSCRRFRDLLYDRNRLKCVQVIDNEEGLLSMVKNIPKGKKDLVRAVIIGNNLRVVEESITAPAYSRILDAFPKLEAIQHRPCYETDVPKMTAAPFGFTPLESLDLFVPDLLCEANQPPPQDWPGTQVKSLTLREYNWWLLYTDVTDGPAAGKCKEYFENLCKYYTGVKRLNLFPVLVADRFRLPSLEAVGQQTKTWINRSNLPDVETVNIRFDAVHKFRKEEICALPRIEFILTKYSPLLRNVKITVDLQDPRVATAFLEGLHPRTNWQDKRNLWSIITCHYLPTPARIQEFARTLARHIPALETVQFLIYDHDSRALPLFSYECEVLRVRKSEPGKPGSFCLQESTMNRLDQHH